MAKVSIIIPTYNVEMYLVECMESVVNQTLKDIEIICINDGSTDGSLEILKSYAQKDDRIVLVDKENGGYGIGMNIGLDKATGEYIGIVEPDDFIPLNMYSDLYEKAVENDLDFIKADFYRFKRDSETEAFLQFLILTSPFSLIGYNKNNFSFSPVNHCIPELIALAFIFILHKWKKNTLLSIAGGTILYMFLVQIVF